MQSSIGDLMTKLLGKGLMNDWRPAMLDCMRRLAGLLMYSQLFKQQAVTG
jgi:hypothetical protein